MAFLYSVIGDNTIENREHLEKLGYKFINLSWDGKYIFTSKDKSEAYYANGSGFGHINCIGNPQLFKAVTAITTTTDIGKYYINNHTGQWRKCDLDMATDYYIEWDDWTEASIAEIQAHFKRV